MRHMLLMQVFHPLHQLCHPFSGLVLTHFPSHRFSQTLPFHMLHDQPYLLLALYRIQQLDYVLVAAYPVQDAYLPNQTLLALRVHQQLALVVDLNSQMCARVSVHQFLHFRISALA